MTRPEAPRGVCLVGNTHVQAFRFVDDALVRVASLPTGGLLDGADGRDLGVGPGYVGVSVVPEAEGLPALAGIRWLRPTEAPMPLRYGDPATLGADRLAAAWGAWCLLGGPVLVVDAGTATTLSRVGDAGSFDGGAITLGVGATLQALADRGARLPLVVAALPAAGLATDTEAAIRLGVVGGHAHMISGLAGEIAPGVPRVITGGSAALLHPLLPGFLHVPDLQARGALTWALAL
ncbi:MAG: type III pantothenate kinase [Candidatus Sericytochromatia bacterium]|nr:type III pantothenate kinase [Candidatus Sericytochromatia bacterium]